MTGPDVRSAEAEAEAGGDAAAGAAALVEVGSDAAQRQEIAAAVALQWAALVNGQSAGGAPTSVSDGPSGERLEVDGIDGVSGAPAAKSSSSLIDGAGNTAAAEGAWQHHTALREALGLPTGMPDTPAVELGRRASAALFTDEPVRAGPAPLAVAPLVALQISPQLSVITAAAPAASDDALVAFAAGQGFDPAALQRMFGRGSVAALPGGVPMGTANAASSGSAQAVLGEGPVGGSLTAGLMKPGAGRGVDGLGTAAQAGLSRLEISMMPAGREGASILGAGPAAGMTATWMALQARGLGQAGVLDRTTAPALGVPSATVDDAAVVFGSGLAGAVAADSAALAGATSASANAGVTGPAGTAHASDTAAARTAEAQPIDLRDHLEQSREALSRRLGEALAARVLSQVERGDWQVRLSVTPQHLGPIDIDLQMRGNRLEAQFQVANGQTQSLIQDSLPRLKEAVGASGMDLASAWVSGGLSDRNRGNPTPGQPDDPASVALNEASGDEQAVSGVETVESRGPGWTPRPGAVDILI